MGVLSMPLPYAACIVAAALGLAYLLVMHLLFERLASHHTSGWEDIGSPESLSSLHFRTMLRVLGFLARRDYLEFNDPITTRLAVSAKVLLIAIVVLCVYLQVVFYDNGLRWPLAI
jgi:hypothetical protein